MILFFDISVKVLNLYRCDSVDRMPVFISKTVPVKHISVNQIFVHKAEYPKLLRSIRCIISCLQRVKIYVFDLSCLITVHDPPCRMCIRLRYGKLITVDVFCQNFIFAVINIDLVKTSGKKQEQLIFLIYIT